MSGYHHLQRFQTFLQDDFLRQSVSDFEDEFQQALINKKLNSEIETVFMAASSENMFLSSSVIKQVCMLGGDVTPFIPKEVSKEIIDKLMKG